MSFCRIRCIAANMPSGFARRPRSLEFIKRWKATEFRQFLLYSGPIVLKDCVSKRVWCNFLVLHVAARLLSSPESYRSRNRQSEELLKFFLGECMALYGAGMITLNLHCLRHLAECAVRFGPVEEFSAFPFEKFLGKIKRILRSGKKPLEQIARRIEELNSSLIPSGATAREAVVELQTPHTQGPLCQCHRQEDWQQYKVCYFRGEKITTKNPNNTVMLRDSSIVVSARIWTGTKLLQTKMLLYSQMVRNFLRDQNGTVWLLGNK